MFVDFQVVFINSIQISWNFVEFSLIFMDFD